jgi:hypothetical protein
MHHEPDHDRPDSPPDVDLERVWAGVAATVWAPRTGVVERVAATVLRSAALARALVTTPSLVAAWLVASAAVLLIGVGVSVGIDVPLVPLLAPALAGVSISFAYGPGTDPAHELAASMPVSDRMVLLVRAIAVFGVNAVMGLLAALLAPAAAGVTWLWLVPMTAVAALSLAAATVAASATIGMLIGLTGWTVTVLATQLAADSGAGVRAVISAHPLLVAYLVVAVVSVCVVLVNPPMSRTTNGPAQ